MEILVTGGAGYIGSHTIVSLIENGFDTVVIDDLYSGHKEAVSEIKTQNFTGRQVRFYRGDFSDIALLDKIIKQHDIKGVIHFAAYSLVGESVTDPVKYYFNNIAKTVIFLNFLKNHGIGNFVFSSSAAVYGIPESVPIKETAPLNPINPYGATKLSVEKLLEYMKGAYKFNYISLRYFNAAGAHPTGIIGEDHNPETHLIPSVLRSLANGEGKATVFGNDYPTIDGTPIRDYIHVMDLSEAHVMTMKFLLESGETRSGVYNLGDGTGFSVMEIIKKIIEITGKEIKTEITDRRMGDPPVLVASYEKIKNELGFQLKYSIDDIISSAWKWHSSHPKGF